VRRLALLVFLATPAAMAEDFALPSLETFRATVERPLFTPGRRAPHAAPPTAEPVMASAVWRLVGFIVDGSGRGVALMRGEEAGQVVRVRPGEAIGGWTVERIAAGEVTLVRDEERLSVPLDGDIPE